MTSKRWIAVGLSIIVFVVSLVIPATAKIFVAKEEKERTSYNISASLQYVYLSGCDTGLKRAEWENALSPAYVKTFDRLSTTFEHIYWLVIKGPTVINSLI